MAYIDILGYTLEINEDYGVIQLINRENYNHLRLKLYDSIILLILRILHDEKKRELILTDVVVTTGGKNINCAKRACDKQASEDYKINQTGLNNEKSIY